MTGLLHALLYLAAWLLTFGLLSIATWYARYVVAVIAALMPALCVFWFLWAWLVAIPMGLFFDGSAAEKKVVVISHWLNDRTADLLLFFIKLPYFVFILTSDIASWLVR